MENHADEKEQVIMLQNLQWDFDQYNDITIWKSSPK